MKIVIDTLTKQAICPPEFFDNVTKINEASRLTESTKELTIENYLQDILKECSHVIVNKTQLPKGRRTRKN